MSIIGLTDQNMRQDARSGRLVSLGTLQKGYREGFGKGIKLFDLDHFRFSPKNGDERLTAAFHDIYGKEPKVIPDVRIPVDLSGNFNIEDCAWMVAGKHTETGSVFMAQSDGVNIVKMRNQDNGRKVDRFVPGERLHRDYSQKDEDGKDFFRYDGKLYAWSQSFAIDLILPEFNQAVFRGGLFGLGVVTLVSHSTYDIAQLISEYQGIITELTSIVANPFVDDLERVKNNIPLRRIPLTLYRSEQTISTPNWKDKADAAGRMVGTRSLLHWQLAASIADAAQRAMDIETQRLIDGIANRPLLAAGQKPSIEQLNGSLFADAPQAQLPEPAVAVEEYGGPNWEDIGEDIWEEPEPESEPESEPENYDWKEAAINAETVDGFCMAYYQLSKQSGVFDNAAAVKKAYTHFFGKDEIDRNNTMVYLKSLDTYVNTLADGGLVKDAKKKAAEVFTAMSENIVF